MRNMSKSETYLQGLTRPSYFDPDRLDVSTIAGRVITRALGPGDHCVLSDDPEVSAREARAIVAAGEALAGVMDPDRCSMEWGEALIVFIDGSSFRIQFENGEIAGWEC